MVLEASGSGENASKCEVGVAGDLSDIDSVGLDNNLITALDDAEDVEDSRATKAYWGQYIETFGIEWRLDANYSMKFEDVNTTFLNLASESTPDGITDALKAYLRIMIGQCQARSVYMAHHIITKLLRSPRVLQCFRSTATALVDACYQTLRETNVGIPTIRQHVSTFRKFYVWAALRCEDRGWSGFSLKIGMQLKLVTVPSTTRGLAVRRMDPDDGPLTHLEYLDVADAVRKAATDPQADIGEVAAMSLMLVLGVNPESLRDLREEDLIRPGRRDEAYVLRVPRIKKRNQRRRRDAFVERELIAEIGDLIFRLVEKNRTDHPIVISGKVDVSRPLFRRLVSSKKIAERGFETVADQVHENWFRMIAEKFVSKYKLTDDIGKELRLTPRRLRYTFMAREVAKGTSPHVIATMMDHSDQRTLLVYFAARLDIVDSLDAALGERLAPLARLFLGKGNAGDRDSLPGVQDDWRADLDLNVAPLACLSCRLFRPSNAPRLREMAGLLSREANAIAAAGQADARVGSLHDLARKASAAAHVCVETKPI